MATVMASDQKLDIGSVLQRSFGVLGNRAVSFIVLAALLSGVPSFFSYYLLLGQFAQPELVFFTSYYWLIMLLSMVTGSILQAVVIRETILYINDRPPALSESVAVAVRRLLPIIGVAILGAIVVGVGFLLLIVPGIIFYIALSVAIPALVEEDLGVIASMTRSWELTRGSRWRIFGLFIILIIAYLVVSAILSFLTSMLGLGFGAFSSIMEGVLAMVFALLTATAAASLYIELRLVKDGATTEGLGAIFA